jgi:hypothetical protein
MKTQFARIFSVLSLAAVTAVAAEKNTQSKSFTVKPGQNLVMQVDRGSIKLLTADSDKVDIIVVRELKRGSDEEARKMYEKHQIEITQDGDTVRVETEKGLFDGVKNALRHLQVEYTVTVPSRFNLNLSTAGGNIDVATVEGEVELHTSGGNLMLTGVKGPIEAHTSGGTIELTSAHGKAQLKTSGGDIRVGDVTGDLMAKTSGGNISVEKVNGSSEVSTSGGDIQIKSAQGTIKARTTGGNINAQLAGAPAADSYLRTTGGNINVDLNERAALNLKARTTGGQVKGDIDGEYNKQKTSLVAQLNGGGPELAVETTGGNIKLRTK